MLIITGSIAYDYIMDFPGKFSEHILPDSHHKLNLSFVVSNFAKRRGGTAGNVSYTLNLLKTQNILFSVAGNDFEEYKEQMTEIGVNTQQIVIDKKNYTSLGFAMTDINDNQIWGYFYGAGDKIEYLKLKKVAKPGDLVLIGPSGARGSLSFVHQCKKLRLPYMFDPGFVLTQINNEDLLFGIKYADYIIGNDYEIHLIQERIPNWKAFFSEKTIITTLGSVGAEIAHYGKVFPIPSVKPAKIVDPTGAGDAWRAGFLAGIQHGFDFLISGQMGAVAASYALEEYGSQDHKFTLARFAKRYNDNFRSVIRL